MRVLAGRGGKDIVKVRLPGAPAGCPISFPGFAGLASRPPRRIQSSLLTIPSLRPELRVSSPTLERCMDMMQFAITHLRMYAA